MDIDNVRDGIKLIKDGMAKLSNGPLDHYLRKLIECHDLLIERFSPAHPGDTVKLLRTPEINERQSWGWMAYKHLLKAGACATVARVEADRSGFHFDLRFEGEQGTFRFAEMDVEKVT